jgi:hypothetical protein
MPNSRRTARVARHKDAARALNALDQREAVRQRPPEAIQRRHDHAVRDASLHTSDRLQQQRPVTPGARLVELLEDLHDLCAAQARPPADLLVLQRRGDEPWAVSACDLGHAHVAVDAQRRALSDTRGTAG